MTRTKVLPCKLTPDEITTRAAQLAITCKDRRATLDDKREAMKEFNEKVKELDAKIVELATQIHARVEDKPVEVQELADVRRNVMVEKRTDTGEIVGERAMTSVERERALQMELDLKEQQDDTRQSKLLVLPPHEEAEEDDIDEEDLGDDVDEGAEG